MSVDVAADILEHARLSSPRHTSDVSRKSLLSGKDALAGGAGGVVAVLLGQPFDLIRVHLQTSKSRSVFSVVRDTWVHEGPLAFYKGAAVPFLGAGVSVAIQFLTFHSLRQVLEDRNQGNQLSLPQIYLCGGGAGIANSFISSPTEHIRTRLQLQPPGAGRLYDGPRDCVRQIWAKAGWRGVFKAYPIATLKEFQAFGCYFASFEASMSGLAYLRGKQRKEMTIWETIPCGAMGGVGFWVGSFPLDVVKTRLQNDGFGADAKYSSTRAVVLDLWRGSGVKGFWRGLSTTLVRTSLSSAGCFAV
jgi:solute carrier family 25 carnitine/acylcarnitine transporter 20/29